MSNPDAEGPGAEARVRTARWNDPASPGDGTRVLVCRYRPRGVPKAGEPWDEWWSELGPSKALHAAAYGKDGAPLAFEDYRARYMAEMDAPRPRFYVRALAERVARGETITLLCSSACTDAATCHRTLLRELVLEQVPSATRGRITLPRGAPGRPKPRR